MKHLEQFATKLGRGWVYLDTRQEFQASVTLYRRRSYVACEQYNANPQADLFLRTALSTKGRLRVND